MIGENVSEKGCGVPRLKSGVLRGDRFQRGCPLDFADAAG